MKRLMISALSSGSGKTVMTCGLLAAFQKRGLDLRAFKCGPDYIDPMFHRRVLGVPSRNLDLFLQGEEGLLRTLASQKGDLALLEGAMGFYDGIGGTHETSPWQVACLTGTPVILVVKPGGSSLTLAAQVKGVLGFRSPCPVVGLLLADCKPMLHAHLQPILESETGLPVLGYLPPMEVARLDSRHLGLMSAEEIDDFSARFDAIARQMEQTVDLERLLALAKEGPEPPAVRPCLPPRCTIAVARDEAFSFYYEDALDALGAAGAELVFFSPLRDKKLPRAHGLYLGGGYPELYAGALSGNQSMLDDIHRAVSQGMPTVAECGGFLYLGQALEDAAGTTHRMVGLLPGSGFRTDRLQRFGYAHLSAKTDSLLLRAGETLPVHEFHYWDSTENGEDFFSAKPTGSRGWACGFGTDTLYAGFPHLHFAGEHPLAQRFVDAAVRYRKETQ